VGQSAARAFFFDGSSSGFLSGLSANSSLASGLNDTDEIVGQADFGHNEIHAFLYDQGQTHDLGTLGGAFSAALSINNLGQIVGWSVRSDGSETAAFLCQDEKMFDLNDLVLGVKPVSESGSGIQHAVAINDAEQIVAWSQSDGGIKAFLLTPVGRIVTSSGTISGVPNPTPVPKDAGVPSRGADPTRTEGNLK
jgi:probable HAF family extracellular repeat protein